MKKLFFSILSFLLLSTNVHATSKHPTLVLVHGALLTSNVWSAVQSTLQNRGFNVITIDTPGRVKDGVIPSDATLSAAVGKICKVLKLQHRPVLLVGHSQAGAIITQATKYCSNKIAGLVYIAAVLPLPGEKTFDLLSAQDNHNFDVSAPLDEKNGTAIPDPHSNIKDLFIGNDVNEADALLAVANMVPEPIALGNERLKYDVTEFNRIPKFYIKTSKDQIVSPETQNKYIQRQHLTRIYTLETGHSPFVTQPHQLADLLEKIDSSLK